MRASSSISHLFLGNRILCSPLEAIYTLLIFIMSKELNASLLQLTILASVKPIASIFAFYISSISSRYSYQMKNYLIVLNIVGAIPCLVFPLVNNPWFYVITYVLFITALRASFPIWNQILKMHTSFNRLTGLISKGTSINYSALIIIPVLIASWMDQNPLVWKYLFIILALLQMCSVILLSRLPSESNLSNSLDSGKSSLSFSLHASWKLLKEQKRFRQYLALFFLGGIGLVMTQPILPLFFKDCLQLSYQDLALVFSLCKGVAFVFTSSFWARWANRASIYLLNFYINLFSCLFIVFLLISVQNYSWLYVAFIMYGIMQAGCELSWNLSGPLFSLEADSTLFSALNLACVGVRGCICSFIGPLIFIYSDARSIFILAGVLCFLGLMYAFLLDKQYSTNVGESLA